MKPTKHTLFIDFDPKADYYGCAEGSLTNEQVLNKTLALLKDIFYTTDICILKFKMTCKAKNIRSSHKDVHHKKIRRSNPFFKCIVNLNLSNIQYKKSIFRFTHFKKFKTVYREASISTTFDCINMGQICNLLLIMPNWEAMLYNKKEDFSFQFSKDMYGFRIIQIESINDNFINNLQEKYMDWNVENECKVEKDKFTCAEPGESFEEVLAFLAKAANINI